MNVAIEGLVWPSKVPLNNDNVQFQFQCMAGNMNVFELPGASFVWYVLLVSWLWKAIPSVDLVGCGCDARV
jgi:hypothetical protein